VILLDARNGGPLPLSDANRRFAMELLVEYGTARGGTPHEDTEVERFDFGRFVGYAMCFTGGPTEPSRPTRLTGGPCLPNYQLRGVEERFRVPETSFATMMDRAAFEGVTRDG
jgi:hypothetical protein